MTKIKTDSRPLYILVKERIDEMIKNGKYNEGDRLPSENSLADSLGVSRATLREALRVLEEEGKVIRQQGVGTFIAPHLLKIQDGIEDLYSVTETIKSQGFEPGTIGFELWEEKMGKIASVFEQEVEDYMWVIERVRTANNEPVVYCRDHLPKNLLADKIDPTLYNNEESLFKILEEQYNIRIAYAITRIIPIIAPEWLASRLKIMLGAPVLLLEQKHYDQKDRMMLFSKNYFRNDKFEFHVVRRCR